MKLIAITLLGVLLAGALSAQQASNECPSAPMIQQLEPLTQEEREVLQQLEDIQNGPTIAAQAQAEANIPLEAFGGCGEQRFLLILPATE